MFCIKYDGNKQKSTFISSLVNMNYYHQERENQPDSKQNGQIKLNKEKGVLEKIYIKNTNSHPGNMEKLGMQ